MSVGNISYAIGHLVVVLLQGEHCRIQSLSHWWIFDVFSFTFLMQSFVLPCDFLDEPMQPYLSAHPEIDQSILKIGIYVKCVLSGIITKRSGNVLLIRLWHN